MSTKVKTGWLHDENGDKFAPKTLTSQIQTSDGILLEDKLQADKNQVLLLTDSLSDKMTKENPTGTGALSINRKDGTAIGNYSTTLGYGGTAGEFATAEGGYTIATGSASHAEGQKTEATSSSSHAEGFMSIASGKNSHAEGNGSRAIGSDSHSEGTKTIAGGTSSHAEGHTTFTANSYAHAEGNVTAASGNGSHVEGVGSYFTLTLTGAANATTYTYTTDEAYNLMEGVIIKYNNQVYYITSLNTDNNTLTLNKTASSDSALNAATVYCYYTGAFGMGAHAEGINTIASGGAAHAEGESTKALGEYSHAEGRDTVVSGNYSHAEGEYTYATGEHQHVQGKYNIEDATSAHIVGNGKNYNAKSNAHTIDWEGNAWFAGDVYVGSTSGTNKDECSKKLATEEKVTELALPLPSTASVSQTFRVSAVDENGKVTAVEAIDMPTGGGSSFEVEIDDTLSQSGKAADAKVVGEKFVEVTETIANLGGGMNATAKSLLITILRNGVYTSDQSANITALENALNESGGDDDTDTGGVTQMGSVMYITGGVTATQSGTALKIV